MCLSPVPSRVLVAVDFNGYAWRGSKRAQAVNELVAKRLGELGFETVEDDAETRAVLKAAAGPEQAARKLRAAYVLQAKLSVRMIGTKSPKAISKAAFRDRSSFVSR